MKKPKQPPLPQHITRVKCYGCRKTMNVDMAPFEVSYGMYDTRVFIPCAEAPRICQSCHANKTLLAKARIEMERHVASCPRHMVGKGLLRVIPK